MISTAHEDPPHGPDDLMQIPIEALVRKHASRVKRLGRFKRINAPQCFIRREKELIRMAEIAVRARVRELAALTNRLLDKK